MHSPEELTDAAISALIAGLDAELGRQEALYAGGPYDIGVLPRPRSDGSELNPTGDYWAGGVTELLRIPTVEVAVPDLEGQDFSIDQHESDVTTTLIVRAWLSHMQTNVLYRQCCRYGAAIFNVLCNPDVATGRGSGFGADVSVKRYQSRWRYNPDTNTKDEVQSAVVLVFYLDVPDIRP